MKKYVLMISVLASAMTCYAGKETGGGIIIAAEFATTGRNALKILSEGDSTMNLNSLLQKIKNVKVIPVDKICYSDPILHKPFCEDAHYDAKNNVILMNYAKWDTFSCQEKILLSSHEFLRASGMETEDYSYSGRFLTQKLATCEGQGGSPADQLKCADLAGILSYELNQLCTSLKIFAKQRQNP